jgi:hypothetical protein
VLTNDYADEESTDENGVDASQVDIDDIRRLLAKWFELNPGLVNDEDSEFHGKLDALACKDLAHEFSLPPMEGTDEVDVRPNRDFVARGCLFLYINGVGSSESPILKRLGDNSPTSCKGVFPCYRWIGSA